MPSKVSSATCVYIYIYTQRHARTHKRNHHDTHARLLATPCALVLLLTTCVDIESGNFGKGGSRNARLLQIVHFADDEGTCLLSALGFWCSFRVLMNKYPRGNE